MGSGGFFLDGTTLTMVGGYNFEDGETGNGILFETGDIFIDTDGQYGPSEGGNFGYEYALSLDFDSSKYTVYGLDSSSTLLSVYYNLNEKSNPWRYDSSSDLGMGTYGFTYTGPSDYSADPVNPLQGSTHNAVAIDLSDLITLGANLNDFTVHNTMECGNDNLMGRGSAPVPEPATVMLVGTGLLGMIAFGRKRFNKKA